jgi:predicted lipoprotein with Yx(FWY)xxD motif
MLAAALAGGGAAVLAGLAIAKSLTLNVAKNAKVTNTATMATTHESIAVNSKGIAVYELSGETVHHALCTQSNSCLTFWFPVKVSSAHAKLSAAKGIKGKLGTWHRSGFFQLTLGGHPLYTFKGDGKHKATATGEKIKSFGGVWNVIAAAGGKKGGTNTTTTTSTTTTNPYYPPYP